MLPRYFCKRGYLCSLFIRIYGKDYNKRLEYVGFNVKVVNSYTYLNKSEINKILNFIFKNLDKKGFLQPDHKRTSMIRNINNIFHRINLSEQEIRILLGIFSTLNEFNKKS